MPMKRNLVKEWLEASPWALGRVAGGAVLTFALTAAEQGLRLYERVMPPATKEASLEVSLRGGYLSVVPTVSMRSDAEVQRLLEIQKRAAGMWGKSLEASGKLAVWPAEVEVAKSTKERGVVH